MAALCMFCVISVSYTHLDVYKRQEYMTIVEQMALDKDVRTLLTETKAGDKITQSADYQTVFHEMEKIAAADSDNIQACLLYTSRCV